MQKLATRHETLISQERGDGCRPGIGPSVSPDEARARSPSEPAADAPKRASGPARFDVPNGCMALSDHEADTVLRALNADRSARLLRELQGWCDDEAAGPVFDQPYKVSELAILGHEIILTLREQIETTRDTGSARADVNYVALACGFILRTGLCGNDSDDAVIASLLGHAASCSAS